MPLGLTINFLFVKVPPFTTSTPTIEVWLGRVENLWIPARLVVPNPTVLIPDIESLIEEYNWIVVLLITLTK